MLRIVTPPVTDASARFLVDAVSANENQAPPRHIVAPTARRSRAGEVVVAGKSIKVADVLRL